MSKIQGLNLRLEQAGDFRVVEELTREAFWNNYVPGCDEHYLLHIMRSAGSFIKDLDFVAKVDGKIVGNIVKQKSLMKISPKRKSSTISRPSKDLGIYLAW